MQPQSITVSSYSSNDAAFSEFKVVELPFSVHDDAAQAWLNAQCEMLAGTTRGIVINVTGRTDAMQTLACWPSSTTAVPKCMVDAALRALREQTVVIVSAENQCDSDVNQEPITCFVANPLKQGNSTGPVAVFELPNSIRTQHQAIIQLLQWGAVWFRLLQSAQVAAEPKSCLSAVIGLLASSLEHTELNAAATTAVTKLATQLSCSRVSIGLIRARTVSVYAISNSTRVDTRLNLLRDISSAMNESVDQGVTLTWPQRPGGLPYGTLAQEVLAGHKKVSSVLSTPLYDGTVAIGALTLERDDAKGFDQESTDVCETFAMLFGPVIALKHDKEKSIAYKVLASLRELIVSLCGRRHVALKINAIVLLGTLVFLSIATGDYRITTQARLEGSIIRVVSAPLDGFVASAVHRAGDIVNEGDVLANLDDRELLLQQLQLHSQQEQLGKEHRAALTEHDRSTTAIVAARQKQIVAQLALIEDQLSRLELKAPLSGIVVSGDLSQSIGSSVETGQELFEIAPLESYRVVLEVDERDIGDVKNNQRGVLTLTGLPNTRHEFTVKRIVPLSTPKNGKNVFEVHAELEATTPSIRPGMEGIGKILVDQRKLVWVWTHELLNWLRLALWTWSS